jgi:hypothetical protein
MFRIIPPSISEALRNELRSMNCISFSSEPDVSAQRHSGPCAGLGRADVRFATPSSSESHSELGCVVHTPIHAG